ncbi:Colicin V secretion protein CvaA [Cardiobacterium hominis]|uniref:Auxiliary transport protein, membrane fusion protein (MFP) family protein n=1 Tax=Cardiobacterium hominis (strain ATCC 15826 / DSM 8339 / NCTC 10426 / 6573) TaxID=638300 RepID=C8N925_CARH6|nr:HlyD family efflux transporter periplasmic adaptor subunit [Cardiobacterium hominis]EEV88864.1 auxiliary transport protein, membrane fusion protein (MFP) family protein [Cardiobacterium hominis ATCC 15826]VEG76461.1 Colicin V secretion protein CvaA [Cardiobacterium hominis]
MTLFRPEALAAQQASSLGRILLFTPRISTFLVAFICLVTVLLVLFVIFGSYTKKATVYGELVPVQGVIKVYPPQSGRVESIAVQHGAKVRKGAVLLRINSALDTAGGDTQARVLQALRVQRETLSDNLARNRAAQKEYVAQMAARRDTLAAQAEMLAAQEKLLASRRALAAKNEARYQRLMKQDYVTREAYEGQMQERLSLDVQLQQLKRERNSAEQQLLALANEETQQNDSFAREAHELSRQQAQVEAQIAETESRQEIVLRAPQDGIVSALLVEVGQQAQAGQPLLALVPQEARYEANLYALSHNMGFVHPGQTVYLRYGAYPYQKFGQYAAQVRDVAKTAAPLNELTDTAFPALQNQSAYRIRAELAQDFILAYGEKQPLMAGMQFEADIVQDRRRIYEWMVEPLFSIREKWSTNAE